MSIKYDKLSRRMFLQGMSATGGYLALGIPLLPSLLPSRAQAQATVIPPRFIAMSSQNGCPRSEDWFPANRPTNPLYMFPALGTGYYSSKEHYAHNGPITTTSSGISTLFDSKFNPYAGKMTFLRGLDYPYTPDGNHDGGPCVTQGAGRMDARQTDALDWLTRRTSSPPRFQETHT
ncbi:MAG: twin-arginine translocation signal domain-containing protein, partial [Bdellovibrionota bacterium]